VKPFTGTPWIQGKEGCVEGADALGLIAEVGIAIVGFAGIVAALRAPGGKIGGYAALRIGVLLGISATAVLGALVPFALHLADLATSAMWALSSATVAAGILATCFSAFLLQRAVLPGPEDRAPGLRFVAPFNVTLWAGNIILQLANVVLLRELWPLYVGLLGLTAHSVFLFGYNLLAPGRSEVPA
jgi:hypothetical protein